MIGMPAIVQAKLAHSPLMRRFLGSAAWSVLGSMISGSITLVMSMLVARLVGKEIYGQFVIIQSTLNMVGIFAGFGIGETVIRYSAALRLRDPARLGQVLALAERAVLGFGLIATLGLILVSRWIATHTLNTPDLSRPLTIAAGAVFFATVDSYQKSVLIGFESMRAFVISTMIGVTAGFPIMLWAAKYHGLKGITIAIVLNTFLQASISRYQMRRELSQFRVKHNVKGCLNEWPILWNFAFPALLASIVVSSAYWIVQALLANTPNGYTELAILGIALQWLNIIMFIPGTAGRVVLPILTDYITNLDHSNSRKILLYAMSTNALFAVPLAVIIGTLSPYIMSLYGKNFENDYIPLILATTTAMLIAIQTPAGSLLAASSRMWLGTLMNGGWAIIYIGLAFLLVDKGATGIMIALVSGYIANAIWLSYFIFREIGKTNNYGIADES